MAEKKPDTFYQKQKAARPKPNDIAVEMLTGDTAENLLDFLRFLKDNKLSPRWVSSNSWAVKCKSETVCHIKIVDASWLIMFNLPTREKWFVGHDQYFADEGMKEFIWENVKEAWCPRACRDCEVTIFGKDFTDVCYCWTIRAQNPEGVMLERAKRVVLAIREVISDLAGVDKA